MRRTPYRILALDVDGTLLARDGTLRLRTIEAVSRAAAAGIRPVLCTGRRYRRALPIAERLGLEAPLVCNSGAIVKDPRDHSTRWRADLPAEVLDVVLQLFRTAGEPAVTFTDRSPQDLDFVVTSNPTGRPLFDDYLARNREHVEVDPHWVDRPGGQHYHLCAIGSEPEMLAMERLLADALPGKVQTFVQKSPRYAGTMCEVLRHDASKWTALLRLAEEWGVEPAEICAVGDDMNDVPMILGAGLGVAMGHANDEVLAAADYVTGSDDEDGLAALIEGVLLA